MATIKKITPEEFKNIVLERTRAIKKKLLEDDAYKALSDPLETKLNVNDKLGDSDKALVYKNTKTTEEKKGKSANNHLGTDVKLNANEKEGGDAKAATAVEVKAGSDKGNKGVTAGQKNANFTSKKDNPKTEVSQPFLDKDDNPDMTKMDKLTDETTKTYVEAGAKIGGKGPTAGQNKATVKEKAPAPKQEERIAKGIETDNGNSNIKGEPNKNATNVKPNITLKESYTRKELIETVKREAAKIAKKKMLEEELKRIDDELANL